MFHKRPSLATTTPRDDRFNPMPNIDVLQGYRADIEKLCLPRPKALRVFDDVAGARSSSPSPSSAGRACESPSGYIRQPSSNDLDSWQSNPPTRDPPPRYPSRAVVPR